MTPETIEIIQHLNAAELAFQKRQDRALVGASDKIPVCGHCGKDAKTVQVCARCHGRGWVGKSSQGGESAKGTGWGNYWTERCDDCGGTGR